MVKAELHREEGEKLIIFRLILLFLNVWPRFLKKKKNFIFPIYLSILAPPLVMGQLRPLNMIFFF